MVGGKFLLESSPGKGTTIQVKLFLPLEQTDISAPPSSTNIQTPDP
jgi:signal transduction histidine kinase